MMCFYSKKRKGERRKKKKTDNGNTGDPSQLLCVHKRKLACDRTRTHIYVQRKKKKNTN